jgi:hypothetical protein
VSLLLLAPVEVLSVIMKLPVGSGGRGRLIVGKGGGGGGIEQIHSDSIVRVGVKDKTLGLERKNSARRPMTFLATRLGGE